MKTKSNITLHPTPVLSTISIFEVVLSAILGRERLERMFRFRLSEIDVYKVPMDSISVKKGKIRYHIALFYYKNQTENFVINRHER